MRVTLCDTCSKNVRPNDDLNFIGHINNVDIPEEYESYIEDNKAFDFCSPECRAIWININGK